MSSSNEAPYGPGGSGSHGSAPGAQGLRPYYTPREDAFVVSAPRYSSNSNAFGGSGARPSGPSSGSSSAGRASSAASSSARTPVGAKSPAAANNAFAPMPRNRYFDSSTDDDLIAATSGRGGSAQGGSTGLSQAARGLLVAGGFQYASTLLAMPFEVGKLLLQIQWAPREEVWVKHTVLAAVKARKEGDLGANLGNAAGGRSQVRDAAEGWGDEDRYKRRKVSEAGQHAPSSTYSGEDADEEEEDIPEDLLPEAEADWGEEAGAPDDEELSDEEDAEKYFNDLSSRPTRSTSSVASGTTRARRKPTDASGYVMRRSMLDEGTRPEFVMPVVFTGGVWEMIKAVARGREGWFGLWKGAFTTFLLDASASIAQPLLFRFLAIFAPGSRSMLPLSYTPYPYRTLSVLYTSHLLTGLLVSPLDLVRTRLVAQSTLPRHRKYRGPYDAMLQIVEQEGGWKTTYLHPHLLIPTILDYTFRPLIALATPLVIDHYLRVDSNGSPVLYALWELIISTIGLGITLPIETVRRRLQVQARAGWGKPVQARFGSSLFVKFGEDGAETPRSAKDKLGQGQGSKIAVKGLRTCVETRPEPYAGVIDALYKIITEETTVSPKARIKAKLTGKSPYEERLRHAREDSTMSTNSGDGSNPLLRSEILAPVGHSSLGGIRSLYRGFSMGFGANLLVFLLTVVSGERNSGTGWTEI